MNFVGTSSCRDRQVEEARRQNVLESSSRVKPGLFRDKVPHREEYCYPTLEAVGVKVACLPVVWGHSMAHLTNAAWPPQISRLQWNLKYLAQAFPRPSAAFSVGCSFLVLHQILHSCVLQLETSRPHPVLYPSKKCDRAVVVPL